MSISYMARESHSTDFQKEIEMPTCNCEHWQVCPDCEPDMFDDEESNKAVEKALDDVDYPVNRKTLINKLEEAKRNPFSRDHNNGLQHAINIIRELKERK